ncbi:MAG TPA: TolC family protein [Bryobacteraceae bacterium]|nr:TolC family protein [Bryobacteraceae bacterium]
MSSRMVAGLLFSMCALAQQSAVERVERVGVGDEQVRLTLEAALEMAMRNNLTIEVERTEVESAAHALKGAKGAFDTVALWPPSISDATTPTTNTLFAPDGKLKDKAVNWNMGVRQKTPWNGVSLNVSFDNSRQTTTNAFTALNPYYSSRLTAAVSAPLWRGRAIDRERAEIRIRSKAAEQSRADFETRVVEVITITQSAYWDLAASIEDAQVAGMGVQLAREQLDRTRRAIDAGTLAPVELAASEAELQRRIDTYVTAVGMVTVAENALKGLISPNREDAIWNKRVTPVDTRQLDVPDTDVVAGMSSALQRRPELRSLELRKAQAGVQKRLASDLTRPSVSLTGSYSVAGLAGAQTQTANPIGSLFGAITTRVNTLSELQGLNPLPASSGGGIPPALVGGYGQSVSNLFGGDYPTIQAGVLIEWNPRNSAAEAAQAQAGLAERRLSIMRRQIEQGIEAEVRNAMQGLATARQRIEAARASERAAQEKLDSEIRLFQTGESTNFLVLTRQNELIDSKRRVVTATLLLNRAVALAQKAVGTALAVHNISLD